FSDAGDCRMWVLIDTTAALASMIGAERILKPFQMAFDLSLYHQRRIVLGASCFSDSTRTKSASTIIATSSSRVVLGFQPNTLLALAALPSKTSTSAGRSNFLSVMTYRS